MFPIAVCMSIRLSVILSIANRVHKHQVYIVLVFSKKLGMGYGPFHAMSVTITAK